MRDEDLYKDWAYDKSDYESEVEEFKTTSDPEDLIEVTKRSIFRVNDEQIFTPTRYQYEIHKHFTQREPDGTMVKHLEGDGIIHRRGGKTVNNLKSIVLPWALEFPNSIQIHIFPTLTQGRTALWNGKGKVTRDRNHDAISYLDLIPRELWKKKNNIEMSLELINGSIYRVKNAIGKDGTGDHIRGDNALGIICDEFPTWKTDITDDVLKPMVAQNGGYIFRVGTPNGENHGYFRYLASKRLSESHEHIKTWHLGINETYYNDGSPIISEDYINQQIDGGADPDKVKQEYYCDFAAITSAAYYKHQMGRCRDDGRIMRVPHDARYPVFRFWDLGKNGTNAAWDFQFPDQNKIHAIGYDCDPELSLYQMHVKLSKQREYLIKKNFYPWDGNSPESTGMTKLEFVRSMGVTEDIEVIKRTKTVDEGIEFAKAIFNKIFFDELSCNLGIMSLNNYEKQVSATTKNFGDPVKSHFSHGADAFRTMATAYARNEIPIGQDTLQMFQDSQDQEFEYHDLEL
jgi:hypothetical protein